jgi:hypothetical protein
LQLFLLEASLLAAEEFTDEEEALVRQDDKAKHILLMSCRGDALADHQIAPRRIKCIKR